MSISIKNLKFSYGRKYPMVLNDISLDIKDGTVNVLLGLNGCGKTTLIKSLAGLFKTIIGDIYYDDKNIKDINITDRSKMIVYVPQKINGIDDVLIGDYLTYGMVNSLKFYQSPSEKDKEKVINMSKKLNIYHLINKKMGEVSGGERQIIYLCSALIQNTKVILLDEPTSSLDLKNQHLILKTLKEIAKEENKTIILSSHNPNHSLFLDCKVALMNNGIIYQYGDAKDIINIENLGNVYGDNICLSKELPYDEISFKVNE